MILVGGFPRTSFSWNVQLSTLCSGGPRRIVAEMSLGPSSRHLPTWQLSLSSWVVFKWGCLWGRLAWFVGLSCRDSLPWSKPSFWDILLSIICPCCSSVVYQGYHVTPVRHQSWGACFFPWKPLRPPWMTFQTCRTYSTHTVYLILLSNVPRSLLLLVTYLARVTAWAWTPFEADVCECNGEEVREPCVPGEGPG